MDGTPHFGLKEGDRCPHLNERGLCNIILHLGKGYLCDICREHPRFYNYTEVAEVGIGMSCPEAARVILLSPDYAILEEIGEVEAEAEHFDFDGRAERDRVYGLLSEQSLPYTARLKSICDAYKIDMGEDKAWLELLGRLEYLDESHKDLFLEYREERRKGACDVYAERFLAYLIFRHSTEATEKEDFSLRLRFCLFLERLLASLLYVKGAETLEDVADLARVISEEIEYSEDNTFSLMYE